MTFYRGISFPFRSSSTSFPASTTDDDLIQQSIVQIIMTKKGERVMRPDFGTNIITFLFENNDALLAELIRNEVFSAIGKYEPRVIVQDVITRKREVENGLTGVDVTVNYIVTATGTTGAATIQFSV